MDRFSTVYHLQLRHDPRFACSIAEGQDLSIGRDPANRLQLAHHSIAPFHCQLRNERGALKLSPVGRAPVLVDSRRLRGPVELSGHESVQLGEIELSFARQVAALAVPPSASASPRPWVRWARYTSVVVLSLAVHAILLLALMNWSFATDSPAAPEAPMFTAFSLHVRREEPPPRAETEAPAAPTLSEVPPGATPDLVPQPPELWEESPSAAPELAQAGADGDVAPGRLASERSGVIGVGGGGLGSGGRSGRLAGRPGRGRGAGGGTTPLGRFLAGVQEGGMDLAFVIDTSVSMGSILDRTKATIDRMVHLLQQLVPDLRVGVVAYRDREDRYLTISSPLDPDIYRALCFILDLEAEGGGDFEEAVDQALMVAIKQLEWRPKARRVIVVLADAPARPAEVNEVMRLAASFASPRTPSRGEGVVAAMFTVSQDHLTQERRPQVADFFRAVARAGHGDFLEVDQNEPLGQELLVLVLGEQFRSELVTLHENQDRVDLDARVIARHRQREDKAWFLRMLGRSPVRAGVVDALIGWSDRRTLEAVADIAVAESKSLDCRYAALYILKKSLRGKVSFDPLQPSARQEALVSALRDVLSRK
jgi:hypothetical protein